MLTIYPALFYYDDTETVPYYVCFPDIEGPGTQGETIEDALVTASDYLGIMLADMIEKGETVPQPSNMNSLSLQNNVPFDDMDYQVDKSFISLVSVNLAEYLGNKEPIKKTLTIPKWADKLGRDLGLNFSQTLTEAIVSKKMLV